MGQEARPTDPTSQSIHNLSKHHHLMLESSIQTHKLIEDIFNPLYLLYST